MSYKPLCFMIMPFGVKPVMPVVQGAPSRINFDQVWRQILEPVIAELGYDPVRADQDTGALIIHEMLERLYFADLVLADMTLPNGNVYYEVGIRHAAKATGCVLLSADWATPLFDTQQMRRVTYPLNEETVDDAAAARARAVLTPAIRSMIDGLSPMNIVLPDYPLADPERAVTMRKSLDALRRFQAGAEAVSLEPPGDTQRAAAKAYADQYPAAGVSSLAMATTLVTLLRDAGLWEEVQAFIADLRREFKESIWMRQQLALALSKAKSTDHLQAIASVKQLIKSHGDSSENQGLIGGRYKRLAEASAKAGNEQDHQRYLNQAIAAYEQGMRLDLMGYFPVSNLARLYRQRRAEGDEERARFALRLTQEACEALRERNMADEWLRPTLLGVTFDLGDYEGASRLIREVEQEGHAAWKLDTTLNDLRRSVEVSIPPDRRPQFEALIVRLETLLPGSS
ncbi:MAG: hypothetical protein FIA97_12775 [Methylococcaceae bacterium]|nr:hypothetical protein [Methylococcaceae bacterium]